jgi:hypothetical protein
MFIIYWFKCLYNPNIPAEFCLIQRCKNRLQITNTFILQLRLKFKIIIYSLPRQFPECKRTRIHFAWEIFNLWLYYLHFVFWGRIIYYSYLSIKYGRQIIKKTFYLSFFMFYVRSILIYLFYLLFPNSRPQILNCPSWLCYWLNTIFSITRISHALWESKVLVTQVLRNSCSKFHQE